jgi:hypothetical protein
MVQGCYTRRLIHISVSNTHFGVVTGHGAGTIRSLDSNCRQVPRPWKRPVQISPTIIATIGPRDRLLGHVFRARDWWSPPQRDLTRNQFNLVRSGQGPSERRVWLDVSRYKEHASALSVYPLVRMPSPQHNPTGYPQYPNGNPTTSWP